MAEVFDLTGKTALITGAGGLLGIKHAEALIEYGCEVILTDHHYHRVLEKANILNNVFKKDVAHARHMDVTKKDTINAVMQEFKKIDILINNAARDPKVKQNGGLTPETRFETMTEDYWHEGIKAIIDGTFLCSQAVANKMLKTGAGVILNIASDLSVIAPDQRIYKKKGVDDEKQFVKPITYSAAKWAVVGMTKYLAVYFADKNIRVNCLSPTGVYVDNIPKGFKRKLCKLIPMGRMAHINEYKGAVVFLCSDASKYMTGHNLVIDGGKTIW